MSKCSCLLLIEEDFQEVAQELEIQLKRCHAYLEYCPTFVTCIVFYQVSSLNRVLLAYM